MQRLSETHFVLVTGDTVSESFLRFQCSTTCGMGTRNRTVTCITPGDACPAFDKPESQKICESAPCTHIGMEHRAPWLYSEWSSKVKSIVREEESVRIVKRGTYVESVSLSLIQCSTECGSGVETRRVACADGSELFCNPKEKPETERQCFGRGSNCDSAKWFTGPWTFVSNR